MTELPFELLCLWFAITVAGSLTSAFAYPYIRSWFARFDPAIRSMFGFAYAGCAPVAAVMAVFIVTQPTAAGFLVPSHCHGNHCGTHTPVYSSDSVLLIGLLCVGSMALLMLMAGLVWAVRRGQRKLRMLDAIAQRSTAGYLVLDSADVLVCCVGLWRPQILVSRGLIEQLEPHEFAAVMAHERAHVQRLDNLRALLLRSFSVFWPSILKRRLCADNRADAEQACDLAAARANAGPAVVARVMRKVAQLSSRAVAAPERFGVSVDGDDVATRLQVLDADCRTDLPALQHWCSAYFGLLLCCFAHVYLLAGASHQAVEWLGLVVL